MAARLASCGLVWHSRSVAESDQTPRRPRYLSFVLLVGWFSGLRTVHEGYVTLSVVGDPLVGETLRYPPLVREAVVEAMTAHSNLTVPVAAAQIVFGGFLLLVCAGTLFGALKRIGYAVQAVLGNMGVAVATFALTGPVRDALVSSMARSPEILQRFAEEVSPTEVEPAFAWGMRIAFALHMLALSGVAWALSRRGVRDFLAFRASQPRES